MLKKIKPGMKLINTCTGEIKEIEKVGTIYFYFKDDKNGVSKKDVNDQYYQKIWNATGYWSLDIKKYQEIVSKRKIIIEIERKFRWNDRELNILKYSLEDLKQIEILLNKNDNE